MLKDKNTLISFCRRLAQRHFYRKILIPTFLFMEVGAPVHAFADETKTSCPSVWSSYIEDIREIVAPLGPDFPLLFESREGEFYDCLDLIRNDDMLKKASDYNKRVPYDRTSMIDLNESMSWPANVCSSGRLRFPHVPFFFSLSLPLDEKILQTSVCRIRVIGGAERMLEEYRNE
jgi:hypothetical protein